MIPQKRPPDHLYKKRRPLFTTVFLSPFIKKQKHASKRMPNSFKTTYPEQWLCLTFCTGIGWSTTPPMKNFTVVACP
jgi:hypothetical protein